MVGHRTPTRAARRGALCCIAVALCAADDVDGLPPLGEKLTVEDLRRAVQGPESDRFFAPQAHNRMLEPTAVEHGIAVVAPGPPEGCEASVEVAIPFDDCLPLDFRYEHEYRADVFVGKTVTDPAAEGASCTLICSSSDTTAHWRFDVPAAGYRGVVRCVYEGLEMTVSMQDPSRGFPLSVGAIWAVDLPFLGPFLLADGHSYLGGPNACPVGQPSHGRADGTP